MDPWLQAVITSVVAVFASSGFWAWLNSRGKHQSAASKLILVLTYDKIKDLGMNYIERGWISREEYEDYATLYYEPYKILGGNGVAENIFKQVTNLPLRQYTLYSERDKNTNVHVEMQNGK